MALPVLKNIPYSSLLIAAIFLALAPFYPAPHLLEKTRMLLKGVMLRPIDFFDILFHLFPALLLVLKLFSEKRR